MRGSIRKGLATPPGSARRNPAGEPASGAYPTGRKDAGKIAEPGLRQQAPRLTESPREDPCRNPPPCEKPAEDLSGAFSGRIRVRHRLARQVPGDIEAAKESGCGRTVIGAGSETPSPPRIPAPKYHNARIHSGLKWTSPRRAASIKSRAFCFPPGSFALIGR